MSKAEGLKAKLRTEADCRVVNYLKPSMLSVKEASHERRKGVRNEYFSSSSQHWHLPRFPGEDLWTFLFGDMIDIQHSA